jgi:HAD superfamily hydrolase (TIGR01490 family)
MTPVTRGDEHHVDKVVAVAEADAELSPIPSDAEPDLRAGAFFDVDNTLMRGASIFYLARGLHKRKFFSTRNVLSAAWRQLSFRIFGSEDPDHIAWVREHALEFVAGWEVGDFEDLAAEILDEVITTKVWPGTRALAQLHLDQGQRVWLVTAAPVEIGRLLARRLGLTGALGTVAEIEDGRYTGRLVGDLMHGTAKADAVRLLARDQGLDLARCSAYSDSANDVPMLSLVGTPYAINPDRKLRAYAKARNWRIRDFRRGRRAARLGFFVAVLLGAAAGAAAAIVAIRRQAKRRWF